MWDAQWQAVEEIKKMWFDSLNDYMVSWLSYFDSDMDLQFEAAPSDPENSYKLWITWKDFLNNDAAFTTTHDQWQNPLAISRWWYLRTALNSLTNFLAPGNQTVTRFGWALIWWEFNDRANRMWFSNQLASADLSWISGRSLSTWEKSNWETLFEFSTQITDKGIDTAPTIAEAFFWPKSAITIANN